MAILRTFLNKPGVVYDAEKTKIIFAEDMNLIGETLETIPKITLSDTEPESPEEGDIWVDTS